MKKKTEVRSNRTSINFENLHTVISLFLEISFTQCWVAESDF